MPNFSIADELPAFEEWLKQLRTPLKPADDHIITAKYVVQQFKELEWHQQDILEFQLMQVAADGDVSAMREISQTQTGQALMAHARDTDKMLAAIYCVSHMLMDGGGNAGFAREWMAATGHTDVKARRYASALSAKERRNPVEQQRLYGMSSLVDYFRAGKDEQPAPFWKLSSQDQALSVHREQAHMLAAILRRDRPRGLQQVVDVPCPNRKHEEKPLAMALWLNDRTYRLDSLLPAIGLAYGLESTEVRRVMRVTARGHVMSGTLNPAGSLYMTPAWDAIREWGDPDIGKLIYESRTRGGSEFIDAIAKMPLADAKPRLELIESKGANLNAATTGTAVAGFDAAHRLLDAAVFHGNPELTGHLLGRGFDPTQLPVGPSRPERNVSAIGIAQAMVEAEGATNPRRHEVLTMVLAAAAHKEAQKAIQEMDLDFLDPAAP